MNRTFTLRAIVSNDQWLSDVPRPALMHISFLVVIAFATFKYVQAKTSPLNALPTVGYSGILTSYITAYQYMSSGPAFLQEGYDKASFGGKPFKIATFARWLVVLSGRKYIQDLASASDEVISIAKPTIENNQADFTFGRELLEDPYHITTIRGPITRNLVTKFNDINDEVMHSFKEYLKGTDQDWITVTGYETLLHLMCRTSNRFFVGPELCRNPRYQDLSERMAHEIVTAASTIALFPRFLKPAASILLTRIKGMIDECREFLEPMIAERLQKYERNELNSAKDERVNDILSWFIETSSKEYHRTIQDLIRRVVMTNVASLHASTMVLAQGIYDLAVHPEYIKEMREEAERIINEHGWTKSALHKLRKIDSFLKESHRLNSVSHYLMVRETLQDFTLSDGTLLSRGTHVGIASGPINTSEEYFQDADTFKAFRFAEMREGDGEYDPIRYQLVSLNPDSVMFGHGKHACPGRFMAVTMIKLILTHILLEYDIQLENGSMERPPNICSGIMIIPNREAKLMFRRRACP
ncbi:Ent-kaurene oxidase [Leucoagaricus sp. SymC.cos]|nr:Ent-kaurene oxidase [Leucoagaricus sp. SymC.cos]